MEINIFLPEAINNPQELANYQTRWGVKFTSAKWYLDWLDDYTPEIASGFRSQNVIPELTWQPQINGNCVSFKDVINGRYDAYLNRFIASVKNSGIKIRITLAPEMNGTWSPWGIGNCGNSANDFKTFWQYVVQKFRTANAPVQWIWAPNVHYWGEPVRYAEIYPGDNYVNFMGLIGYNWGTTQSWSSWQSFRSIFQASYNDLISLSGKNIIISEFASAEKGGNKAQWILDMFSDLQTTFQRIIGITWFNINKETDWRINSSETCEEAFKKGVKEFFTTGGTGGSGSFIKIQGQDSRPSDSDSQIQNNQLEDRTRLNFLGGDQNKQKSFSQFLNKMIFSIAGNSLSFTTLTEMLMIFWLYSGIIVLATLSLLL